jgi:hypothetical protein
MRPNSKFALIFSTTALLIPVWLETYRRIATGTLLGDFRAFYCAARVASHGFNPYLAGPLHDCEAERSIRAFFTAPPDWVVPAPLPGYVLAAIEPLTHLSLTIAAVLWVILSIAVFVVAVRVLVTLSGLKPATVVCATALPLGMVPILTGEVTPFCIAALCVCAFLCRQGRWGVAGILAGFAMLEPHVALPACLSLAIWQARSRLSLAAVGVVLTCLSLAFLGPQVNVEYLTRVLPAHALSELSGDNQYSFAAVLAASGVSAQASLAVATGAYFATVGLGVIAARLLARTYADDAMLALVPPAFAVLGGPFIHLVQIGAAIPVALLLLVRARHARPIVFASVLLLAIPWQFLPPIALIATALAPAALLTYILTEDLRRSFAIAALVVGFSLLTLYGVSQIRHVPPISGPAVNRASLAENTWAAHVQRNVTNEGFVAWLVRGPTWAGLILLLAGIAVELRASQRNIAAIAAQSEAANA